VPPTKKLDEMLEYFRAHDVSAALVLSEFGGVEGMVTLRMVLDVMFRPVSSSRMPLDRFTGPDPGTNPVTRLFSFSEIKILFDSISYCEAVSEYLV